MVRNPTRSYQILRFIYANGNEEQRRFLLWVIENERIKRGMGSRCR